MQLTNIKGYELSTFAVEATASIVRFAPVALNALKVTTDKTVTTYKRVAPIAIQAAQVIYALLIPLCYALWEFLTSEKALEFYKATGLKMMAWGQKSVVVMWAAAIIAKDVVGWAVGALRKEAQSWATVLDFVPVAADVRFFSLRR